MNFKSKKTETFFRRNCLKAFFHETSSLSDNRDFFERLNTRKSNWFPPERQFASLDLFKKKCRHDISKLDFDRKLSYSNLSEEE